MQVSDHIEAWTAQAREQGATAGRNAASWVIDGNHPTGHYARLARLMDDGDPALDEYLPARPNLSGQWADDPVPATLFEEITGLDAHAEASWNYDAYQGVLEALCEAWEAAAAETFDHECERLVKAAIPACEACGKPTADDPDFCPACLADMRAKRGA